MLTLPVTHLLQSCVFISSTFSCQAFTLTGSSVWQSEHSICSYLSPLFSQPFLLLLVCLCGHCSFPPSYRQSGLAGSLPPSAFSLSTQLFALAIHRHTVGTHPSAAYNFRCHCQHNCCPCTVSAQTPTVFPGYKCHLSSAL